MRKILFIILIMSTAVQANWSLGGGVGFGSYRNDYLDTIDVSTTGSSLFLQGEYKMSWLSLGAEVARFASKGQINHNGVNFYFHQDALQYGPYAKLHLLNFFFRMGYTFHSASSYITDFPDDSEEQTGSVTTTYSTEDNSESSSGTHFGLGFTYPLIPSLELLVDAERYSWFSGTGSSFVFKLGLVYNFGGGGGGGGAAAN